MAVWILNRFLEEGKGMLSWFYVNSYLNVLLDQ